jgi:hypothetical protein
MSYETKDINQLIQRGDLTIDQVRALFSPPRGGDGAGQGVAIEDWKAEYNKESGQFSEFCTVLALPDGPAITGAGLLAYSENGEALYCCNYTDGFTSSSVIQSIGTALFKHHISEKVKGVVFGTVSGGPNFFEERTLHVGHTE